MRGKSAGELQPEQNGEAGFPGVPSEALDRRWSSYGLSHVPYHLLLLAKMLDKALSATTLREDALTLAEWRVMANLARLGESTVNALAEHSLVDRAEVSRASKSLEERGFIARGSHPTSKAKKLLWLTEAGRGMANELGEERRGFYGYLMAEMSEDMRQQLDDLLLHLAIRLERHEPLIDIG